MLLPLTSTLLGPDRLGFCLFISSPLSTALFPGLEDVLKCIYLVITLSHSVLIVSVMTLNMFIKKKKNQRAARNGDWPIDCTWQACVGTCNELMLSIPLLVGPYNCNLFTCLFQCLMNICSVYDILGKLTGGEEFKEK